MERQYDPTDDAFIPRAFSITHVNLTHRNWTAVGIPGFDDLPIVDPRGLLTPFWDGWSLDCWVVVSTRSARDGVELVSRIDVTDGGGRPECRMTVSAKGDRPARLVVAIRPFNPEGVSFVHDIRMDPGARAFRVDRHESVTFDAPP